MHRKDSVDSDRWRCRRKHIFILTNAGKPVYARYGDESVLSSLFGVVQALLARAPLLMPIRERLVVDAQGEVNVGGAE